jgi:hypothetical protein
MMHILEERSFYNSSLIICWPPPFQVAGLESKLVCPWFLQANLKIKSSIYFIVFIPFVTDLMHILEARSLNFYNSDCVEPPLPHFILLSNCNADLESKLVCPWFLQANLTILNQLRMSLSLFHLWLVLYDAYSWWKAILLF